MIFDTDVIIWAQRGKRNAVDLLESQPKRHVSIVSYMEFVQSARSNHELMLSKNFFSTFQFETLPITPVISNRAALFIEKFSMGHSLSIADALIAATAFETGLPLATSNYKHYKMIAQLALVKLRVVR